MNAALNNPSCRGIAQASAQKSQDTPVAARFCHMGPQKNISSTKPDVLGGCSENQGQGSRPLNSQLGKPQEPQISLLVEDNHCPSPILPCRSNKKTPKTSVDAWLEAALWSPRSPRGSSGCMAGFSWLGQNSGTQPKRYPNNSWFIDGFIKKYG